MADTSLIFNILAKDKASGTLDGVAKKFGTLGKAGALAAGAAALGAVGAVLKTGYGEVSDYQAGLSQLEAGLKSTGNVAGISAQGMEDLASQIQDYSGQTDDSIVDSEKLLLTFTNIRNAAGKNNDVFTQATKISADMAARMGTDASASAIQLGKALNDPVKGITALTRVGVSFTDGQKKQIEAMVKSGNTLGAQKVILGELNKEFGGSAKAFGQTLPGQVARAKRAFEDFSQNIVGAMLPAVTGLVNFFVDKALPGLTRFGNYLVRTLGPVFTFLGDAVKLFFGSFTGKGADVGNELGSAMNPIIDAGARVRSAFDAIMGAGKKLLAVLVPIFRNQIVPAVKAMVDVFVTKVLPVYQQVWSFIYTKVIPAFIGIVTAVAQRLQPVFKALGNFITGTVVPVLAQLAGKIREWLPTLESITQKVISVIGFLARLAATILSVVLPPAIAFVGFILRNIVPAIATLIGWVLKVVNFFLNNWKTALLIAVAVFAPFIGLPALVYKYWGAISGWFSKYVFGPLKNGATDLASWFGAIWHGIGAGIQWVYDHIIKPVIDTILAAINGVKDAWNTVSSQFGNHMPKPGTPEYNKFQQTMGNLGAGKKHDQGGILPLGTSLVVNKTGKPEAVLNAQQWSDIHAAAMNGGTASPSGGSGDLHIHLDVGGSKLGEVVLRDFRQRIARREVLGLT